MQLEDCTVTCPYCWQEIPLEIDVSGGEQSYVEDCSVCCRPLLIRVSIDHVGNVRADVNAETE